MIAVSTSAIIIRFAFQAANTHSLGFSLLLATSRLTLAALFLLPTCYSSQPITARSWRYGILAGFCLAIHFAAWISSLAYTSIAASTALVTTNPVWVALISWLWLKEMPQRKTVLGIVVAITGGLLIAHSSAEPTDPGSQGPLIGNLLALAGAWAVSVYLLLGQAAQRQGLDLHRYMAIVYTTAALLLLPIPPLLGIAYLGYSPPVYGWILLLALIPQLVGHTILNWSLRWISPTRLSLAILFEPICASVLAYLLFGERPLIGVLMGGFVVVVGVTIVTIDHKALPKPG